MKYNKLWMNCEDYPQLLCIVGQPNIGCNYFTNFIFVIENNLNYKFKSFKVHVFLYIKLMLGPTSQ